MDVRNCCYRWGARSSRFARDSGATNGHCRLPTAVYGHCGSPYGVVNGRSMVDGYALAVGEEENMRRGRLLRRLMMMRMARARRMHQARRAMRMMRAARMMRMRSAMRGMRAGIR